jgi:hypothetical protein
MLLELHDQNKAIISGGRERERVGRGRRKGRGMEMKRKREREREEEMMDYFHLLIKTFIQHLPCSKHSAIKWRKTDKNSFPKAGMVAHTCNHRWWGWHGERKGNREFKTSWAKLRRSYLKNKIETKMAGDRD